MQDLSGGIVGEKMVRVDALSKALGTAKYCADMKTDDMLIGKALYSKYPHALIKNIDTNKAKQLEGVVAVMTAADLPGRNGYGIVAPDKPVIAEKKVRYLGDPVALVAATSEDIALKAINLIEVDYEVLPFVSDPREALAEGAPLVYENHPRAEKGNLLTTVKIESGDTNKAFDEADVIIENYYETPMVEHCYLERDVCIAIPELATGGLTIISPQQAVYATKRTLAPVFNISQNILRIISPTVGGGFGGKEDSCLDVSAVAGVLALKTKRTVFIELSRNEVFSVTGKRHAAYIKHKLAATNDGKITAIDVETILDKGAYTSMGGIYPISAVTMRTAIYAAGAYMIPNARVKSLSVLTNNQYSCAFRGFGAPQAYFAIESQIDDLARTLNMDPFEIRLKNILRDNDQTIFGHVMKESRGLGLPECITEIKDKLEWHKPIENNNGRFKRGRGIGVFMYGTSIPLAFDGASAFVELHTDGTLSVAISTTEMGQGAATVFTQMAAESFGTKYDSVIVYYSDTGLSPDCGPTVGSRATTIVGNAIIDGCKKLRNNILTFAAREFNVDIRNIDMRHGKVYVVGKPEISMTLSIAANKAKMNQVDLVTIGTWYPPKPSFREEDGQGDPLHAYTFGAQGVEIEVDTETGRIDVLQSVLACDVGKAINPDTVVGQMEGGVAMGIGWSLMEECIIEDGVLQNTSFQDYMIPTIKDVPLLKSIIVEHPNELGPFGAKGIGEPPIIPAAPAIRNALFDAIGIKLNIIPLTPQKVIEALKANKGLSNESQNEV